MNNILITGVSGGIGTEVARQLLEAGNSIIGCDLNFSDTIRELEEKYPHKAGLVAADLMDTDNLPDLIKSVVNDYGPIGGFVHCAGFDKMSPIALTKAEDIEMLWKIHALVPMLIIAALSKKRNHEDGASIVLISSQSAHEGAMGHTAYASAKGAIEGYLAPAAAELMEKDIRINEVCFAPVKTQMSSGWMDKLTDAGRQKLMDSYPLGIGSSKDAANLICFLLSEKAGWINGQIFTADGGHSVRKV